MSIYAYTGNYNYYETTVAPVDLIQKCIIYELARNCVQSYPVLARKLIMSNKTICDWNEQLIDLDLIQLFIFE